MKDYAKLNGLNIAKDWYRESDIVRSVGRANRQYDAESLQIPADVTSPEFGRWLQYQLAMMKGVQLGRQGWKPEGEPISE